MSDDTQQQAILACIAAIAYLVWRDF